MNDTVNERTTPFISYSSTELGFFCLKKRGLLAVSDNLNGIFKVKPVKECDAVVGFPIEKALNAVVRQMEIGATVRERSATTNYMS